MSEPTEESFLKDVAKHQMVVIHDDGLFRHLQFRAPDSWGMHFNITTVPGLLFYTGDMGSYSFSRLRDMLQFFRGEPSGRLCINRSYWAEKLVASDCSGRSAHGATEYSPDVFRSVLWKRALNLAREAKNDGATSEQRAGLLSALADVRAAEENEYAARDAAYHFKHRIGRHTYAMEDFWEHSLHEYTFRFTWACYAIVWAIRAYDAAKAEAEQPV